MKTRCFTTCLLIVLLVGACTRDPDVTKRQYLQRGIAYHAEGKYNEAIIQLKNALQIDPKFAPALHAIGRAYRAKSWDLDAMRELRRAVELAPDDVAARADLAQVYLDLEIWSSAIEQADAIRERGPVSAAELYIRGTALNGQGDPEGAVTLLSKALTLGLPTSLLQKAYGDSLAALGRHGEAETAYRAALGQQPTYGEALLGLASLLRRQGKLDAALELLDQARAVAPQSSKVALALSDLHTAEGQLDAAIKDLEKLPRQTWSPRVVLALAGLYIRTQQFEKATLTLRPLVQMMPDAPMARYLLAHSELALNRVDDAIRDFQIVAARVPDNALVRYSLGSAYLAGGRAHEALREFDAVAKPLDKLGEYHLQVARALLQLGDFDRAVKAAQGASGLMPQSPQPWGVLGLIYVARGDLKRAEAMYTKAVEVDPSFGPGRVALGNVYNIDKKPEEALKEYETALQTNPQYVPALRAKVATLVQQNRTDEAMGVVQAALKNDSKNVELITILAALYDKKGDRRKSEEELKRAIQTDEKYAPARVALARLLIADKRESEAIAQLQRIVADRPGDIAATLMLANIHATQARYDQAIAILEPAVKVSSAKRELTLALSDLYIKRSRFDEAVALLSPMVSADPSFVQPRILLGLAYLGRFNTAAAISQFEQVNQINPKFAEGHYYRARALLTAGDVDGARKSYQRALDLVPDSKGIRIELAALSGQKLDDALLASRIDDLRSALDRDPGNIGIRYALARAYLTRNQRKESEAEYRRILEVAPTFVPAYLALGALRFQDGKSDEAADFLKAALRTEPQNLQANLLLGDYFQRKGNLLAALQHLETANKVSPPSTELKLRLAALYAQSGRVEQGLVVAKEVITSQPKLAAAHYVMGQLLLQRGDLQQAADALNTAIGLQPNLASAYFLLGNVHERKGEPDRAIVAYRKAQSLSPRDPAVLNNLAWIYASRSENLEEALSLALSAQELAPNSPPILDTVGFVHYKRKEYSKAEPVFRKAVELGATAPTHYWLGMTYYRLGRKEDAITSLKRSLQLDGRFSDADEARRVLHELGAS